MILRIMFLIILSISLKVYSIDKNEVVQIVFKIIDKSSSFEGEEVWPGFQLNDSPSIITFSDGSLYALNLKSESSVWQALEIEDQLVLYTNKDLWGLSKVEMQTNFQIEGQNAYVFNLEKAKGSEQERQKAFEIFLHERFHRYQFSNFKNPELSDDDHEILDSDVLAMLQLEEILLRNFLSSKGDSVKQLEYLKDFVSVAKMRRALSSANTINWEDNQQKMEGLADYVSLKFFDRISIFNHYDGSEKLSRLLDLYCQDPNVIERAIKWRHYGVGAAIGYALDFLNVGKWKEKIEGGDSLIDLLEKEIGMDESEVLMRLEQLSMRYGYRRMVEAAKTMMNRFQQERQDLLIGYSQAEGRAIIIGQPKNSTISGGGTTARQLTLQNGSMLSLEDSSTMANDGQSWVLELDEVPYVFQHKNGFREFKLEEDAEIAIDGKIISLKDFKKPNAEKRFSTISWKGRKSRFRSSKHKGVLKVESDGNVRVYFD